MSDHSFASMVRMRRHDLLCALIDKIDREGIATRWQFSDLMRVAYKHGGLDIRAMSDELGFAHSTIYRWCEGQSAPHPTLWPTVVAYVRSKFEERAAELVLGN